MLTKAQKKLILDAFKMIDVKKLEIGDPKKPSWPDEKAVKWFRFGSYNGLLMAQHIIKQLPEKPKKAKVS